MRETFTNENVLLQIETTNEEDENAMAVKLQAKMLDQDGTDVAISWHVQGEEVEKSPDGSLELGEIVSSKSVVHSLALVAPSTPSNYTLGITASYRLESTLEAEPALSKTLTIEVPFVSPFEANYDFGPRLHPDDYPDFFSLPALTTDTQGNVPQAQGIKHRWCLTSRIASFASEALTIESTAIVVNKVTSNMLCILDGVQGQSDSSSVIEARGLSTAVHHFDTRRFSMEDRRVSAVDCSLAITWRRQDPESTPTTTLLPVPHLTIPAPEPRVLCTAESIKTDTGALPVHYTIENPSMHFLNLSLTMEASSDFAFGGPKVRSISLTPLSRVTVSYSILVYESNTDNNESGNTGDSHSTRSSPGRGRWIWPMLRVTDPYFNRALKIMGTGPDTSVDDRGNVGIWVATAE